MAEFELTDKTKKIIKSAQDEGIGIEVRKVSSGYYFAYAYNRKEFEDCLKEFDKKILLSTLTMDEYAMHCLDEISAYVVGKNQEKACRGALEQFRKNQEERKIIGALEGFFETGTEGVVWSVYEDGKKGYEGLHHINTGDHLTIYGEKGEILFRGKIFSDRKAGWTEYPLNPGHGQPCALGYWVHWTQIGWEPDDWAKLFMRGKKPALRAELIQKLRNETAE